jgi:hypothetical protein
MNPKNRDCGFGNRFLGLSIGYFQESQRLKLLAKIKPGNVASSRIFKSLGFQKISSSTDLVTSVKADKEIIFKEVSEDESEVLFDFLKRRVHSISDNKIPTRNEHYAFVKAHPYRHLMILKDDSPIGTFCLQEVKSIGLNIMGPSLFLVSEGLAYIREKFKPPRVKSKVPPYFYVNIPYDNEKLGQLLLDSKAMPMQISYKI